MHTDLLQRISVRIRIHFADRSSLASLIIDLIAAIIKCQHIVFGQPIWKVLPGIGTGLGCGAQLANLHLADLDVLLAPHTLFFGRYLDAIIYIASPSCNVMNIANRFHDTIVLGVTAQGSSNVPLLDLALSLSPCNAVSFELYRKPANAYQYLPRGSCHSSHTFCGVVVSECTRILRRCQCRADADKHLAFFHSKLLKRGYGTNEVLQCTRIAQARHSGLAVRRHTDSSHVRKAFLKVTHNGSNNYACINRAISKYQHASL